MTRWNASDARLPYAVGSVSGPMIFSCSMTEPGQPCETSSGRAFSCFERTCTKWMSRPSISVMNCGLAWSDVDVKGGDLTVPLDAFAGLYRAQGGHLDPTPRW